jgi:hypothetical protein
MERKEMKRDILVMCHIVISERGESYLWDEGTVSGFPVGLCVDVDVRLDPPWGAATMGTVNTAIMNAGKSHEKRGGRVGCGWGRTVGQWLR